MATLVADKNLHLTHFEQLQRELSDLGPPWLSRLRKSAMARFQALGWPGPRTEDWRFTNLTPLTKIPFELADGQAYADPEQLVGGLDGPRLVCINGAFSAKLSALDGLPSGVIVTSLAAGLRSHAPRFETH